MKKPLDLRCLKYFTFFNESVYAWDTTFLNLRVEKNFKRKFPWSFFTKLCTELGGLLFYQWPPIPWFLCLNYCPPLLSVSHNYLVPTSELFFQFFCFLPSCLQKMKSFRLSSMILKAVFSEIICENENGFSVGVMQVEEHVW